MRTDRAGSQASQGTQGGKSYPRDNSQVMPVVIEIILPRELFNHWQSRMRGDKIEECTSLIASATVNCLPSPAWHSSHQHFGFLQPHFSVSVHVSSFSWEETLMDKPYQLFPAYLMPFMTDSWLHGQHGSIQGGSSKGQSAVPLKILCWDATNHLSVINPEPVIMQIAIDFLWVHGSEIQRLFSAWQADEGMAVHYWTCHIHHVDWWHRESVPGSRWLM